jgi:hypothetical protein
VSIHSIGANSSGREISFLAFVSEIPHTESPIAKANSASVGESSSVTKTDFNSPV